ncbi:ABC transporter permease [Amaricoccus tamworthensis]|uniref:ABC transporter permease n=1 Tax=Amaricoccus tamworthensis TaxID=57002 RepID=UPI003C7EB1FE
MRLPVAARLALRELRGGLRGFGIFLTCLALGVAAITAVGTVRSAIEAGLTDQAAVILGGDAEMEFAYRFADEAERTWMRENATGVSEIVDFRSMAAFDPENSETERTLVQVKAVDDAYPLLGELTLEGGGDLHEALETTDDLPGIIAESILIDRLGLEMGDTLRLGTKEFRLNGQILREPDAATGGVTLGPRVMVKLADLEDSGLLADGSLFESSYRLTFQVDANLDTLSSAARAEFEETGMQWRDRRNGTPGVSRFVDRLGSFLILIGLAGLAVGGVGVSSAVRAYLDRKTETIATLKTLGATGRTVFATYFIQIGILSAIGITIGLVAGSAVPILSAPLFRDLLPFPTDFGVFPGVLAEAAIYGALTALIFTLWPLARSREIRAAELFRDQSFGVRSFPRPVFILATGALVAVLVAIATAFSGAERLTLTSAAGIIGALLLLLGASHLLRLLTKRLAASRAFHGKPPLRWALASVGRSSADTSSVVLSLGLGLAVMAAIGQIDANLRNVIQTDLPERAPAYFVVDIQNDQLDGFLDTSNAYSGVEDIDTAPMLRGVITRINDRPAREVAGNHWTLRGDRGLTYAAQPGPNMTITEGEWWPEDYDGPPLMSFAEEEAQELGVTIGDTITVNVLGRDITATISNLRDVQFDTMGINFVMLINPAAVAGAPHTHIATIYADQESEAPLIRELADLYPNITAVRVRDAIARVAEALESIGAATRWGASATLLTGLIVLIGAAAAGERARVFEAAVLKTLGASRRRILTSFALRSAFVGLAAGTVAMAAGAIAGWWVMTSVMDAEFTFEPVSALIIIIGGALTSLLAGLMFALRPLAARPAGVLRSRD